MIRENVSAIRQRTSAVCARVNRDPAGITIVAVSKGRTPEEIKEAAACGITDIGENRVQEAIIKFNTLRAMNYGLRTHMVGRLQTNKARDAVRIFDLIHSVDSLRLAGEIDRQAAKINKIQDILFEIKTSPEESKSGLKAEDSTQVIKETAGLKNINIKGLMTIAPIVDNPEHARPYFRKLRELLEEINAQCTTRVALRILSMGMSNDFEVAIEEGATMIRVGRAIFNP